MKHVFPQLQKRREIQQNVLGVTSVKVIGKVKQNYELLLWLLELFYIRLTGPV